MNLAIIGRSELLYNSALALVEQGHQIKLIITAAGAPEYKRQKEDFQHMAEKLGARFIYTARINRPNIMKIIAQCGNLDLGISVNYTSIISQAVIRHFRLGILNSHSGDLPRYRGNACQAWAIINGETKIGLCIHKMVGAQLDSGDIIARAYFPIDINTRVGTVYQWMETETPGLFSEAVAHLSNDGNYYLEKQSQDPKDILRCYPREPRDGCIDWTRSNEDVLRLINASSEPYAGAFCHFEEIPMTIWRAALYHDHEQYCAVPGQVCYIDRESGDVVVITGKGKLKISDIGYLESRGKPALFIKSTRKRLR